MKLKLITEGKTKLYVPEIFRDTSYVFFNPDNKIFRNLNCLFVSALNKNVKFLDLLAGTGASGLRIANETENSEVYLNDKNPYAYELIIKNARLNNLDVMVYNKEANLLMRENVYKFDIIEIDPFGTPIPYLDNALATVRKNGYLIITATDLAPLNGVNINACYRKYGAIPVRIPESKEIGLRILIGYIIRTAAKYSRAIKVLLATYAKHMYKVYVFVEHGKKRADESLKNIGFLYICEKCFEYEVSNEKISRTKFCKKCGKELRISGPLYIGSLKDENILLRMKEYSEFYLNEDKSFKKFFERYIEEYDTFLYYDLHHIASLYKIKLKSMEFVINELRNLGFKATRTIFSDYGIKTNATVEDILKILRN